MRRNIKCSNVKVLECYQSFYNSTDINLIYDKENFSNKNKNYSKKERENCLLRKKEMVCANNVRKLR